MPIVSMSRQVSHASKVGTEWRRPKKQITVLCSEQKENKLSVNSSFIQSSECNKERFDNGNYTQGHVMRFERSGNVQSDEIEKDTRVFKQKIREGKNGVVVTCYDEVIATKIKLKPVYILLPSCPIHWTRSDRMKRCMQLQKPVSLPCYLRLFYLCFQLPIPLINHISTYICLQLPISRVTYISS